MASITDLPSSLLIEIFIKTDLKDWIKSIPNVCQLWQNVVINLLWSKVESFGYECYKEKHKFMIQLSKRQKLNAEVLYSKKYSSDIGLSFLISKCPERLKSLRLGWWDCCNSRPESVAQIGVKFQNLQKFNLLIYDIDLSFGKVLAEAIGNMVSLEILEIISKQSVKYFSEFVSCELLETIISKALMSCKKLRKIDINLMSYLPDVTVWPYLEDLPHLEEFQFEHYCNEGILVEVQYLETILNILTNCSDNLNTVGLKCVLDRNFDGQVWKSLMMKLAKKPIEKLCFGICLPLVDDNIPPELSSLEEMLSTLASFKQLKELTLDRINFSSDSIPLSLRHLACNLCKLNLSWNAFSQSQFFDVFTYGMPKLVDLEINYCHSSLIEKSVVDFVLKCPKLCRILISDMEEMWNANLLTMLFNRVENATNNTWRSDFLDILFYPKFESVQIQNENEVLSGLKLIENEINTIYRIFKPMPKH